MLNWEVQVSCLNCHLAMLTKELSAFQKIDRLFKVISEFREAVCAEAEAIDKQEK